MITISKRLNLGLQGLILFGALPVLAASELRTKLGIAAGSSGLKGDYTVIISGIVSTVLGTVGLIFFILMIVGGIQWMTAGGNDQRVGQAKKLITGAAIGLAIVITAYTITVWLTSILSGTAAPTAAL